MNVFAAWLDDSRDYYANEHILLGLFASRMQAMIFLRDDSRTRSPSPRLWTKEGCRVDEWWCYQIEEITVQGAT